MKVVAAGASDLGSTIERLLDSKVGLLQGPGGPWLCAPCPCNMNVLLFADGQVARRLTARRDVLSCYHAGLSSSFHELPDLGNQRCSSFAACTHSTLCPLNRCGPANQEDRCHIATAGPRWSVGVADSPPAASARVWQRSRRCCDPLQTWPHAVCPRPCPSLNTCCDWRTSCLQLFISPMGAGEVTDLDYLAIMCGCMVVKARGRGFAALPNLFKHEETGAAVNPDWSNLRSTITALLQVPPLLTQQPCQWLTLFNPVTPYCAANPRRVQPSQHRRCPAPGAVPCGLCTDAGTQTLKLCTALLLLGSRSLLLTQQACAGEVSYWPKLHGIPLPLSTSILLPPQVTSPDLQKPCSRNIKDAGIWHTRPPACWRTALMLHPLKLRP